MANSTNTSDLIARLSPEEYERLKKDLSAQLQHDFKVHPMQKFKDQIYQAKMEGLDWVEATQDVINFYNPKGLGPKGNFGQGEFFVFDGIKVCLPGQSARIQALIDTPMSVFHHAGEVAKVVGLGE